MSDFMFFVPNVPAVPAAMLKTLGLADVVPVGCGQAPLAGPGGTNGVIMGINSPLRYAPDGQHWYPASPKGSAVASPACQGDLSRHSEAETDVERSPAYWFGWDHADRPSAEDLLRERFITGKVIRLADGDEWICPTARLHDGKPKLPMRIGLDEDGNDTAEVVAEYAGLWQLACEVWETAAAEILGSEAKTMSGERTLETAAQCLNANYRVNLPIVKAMGLLSTENVHEILRALVDFDQFRAMLAEFIEKKNSANSDVDGVGEGIETATPPDNGRCDDADNQTEK